MKVLRLLNRSKLYENGFGEWINWNPYDYKIRLTKTYMSVLRIEAIAVSIISDNKIIPPLNSPLDNKLKIIFRYFIYLYYLKLLKSSISLLV